MPAKPGERKTQILETLAHMLEQPQGEKITTAALAARLDVSEAALYRHFASKAQMFEGLIEFIEQTVFSLINRIATEETRGLKQLESVIALLLAFAQKNQGMTRVLIGDALVNEDVRLQARINQLHDRIEAVDRADPVIDDRLCAVHGTAPAEIPVRIRSPCRRPLVAILADNGVAIPVDEVGNLDWSAHPSMLAGRLATAMKRWGTLRQPARSVGRQQQARDRPAVASPIRPPRALAGSPVRSRD